MSGIGTRRQWGWHPLRPDWAARIVEDADVRPGELVLDLGAGYGALTDHLVAAGARVVAVELHPGRADRLRRKYAGEKRVRVVRADLRALRLPREPFRVVASPPYALTTAVVTQLLSSDRLRAADLVWRLGFPDWRPASTVFSIAPQDFRLPQNTSRQQEPATQSAQSTASWAAPSEPARTERSSSSRSAPSSRSEARVSEPQKPASDEPQRWSEPAPISSDEPSRPTRSRRPLAVAASLLAIAGAGAWFAFGNGAAMLGSSPATEKAAANSVQTATARTTFETAAIAAADATAELDSRFQKRALWSAVKREFPEWYDVRLK